MMLEAIVQSSIEAVDIINSPIPTPSENEVVVKVIVAGTNPKDWKYPLWKNLPHNSGDDMAGIIYSVGKNVYEFKPGDRVAAYHETGGDFGTFAEYAVAPAWTTFHLPPTVSFEEAATLPVAALTAAVALYGDMKFPPPYMVSCLPTGSSKKTPLIIYGVTTAVGAFAAKLARLSGISPIIGVAGRAGDFAKTLVDHVIDYRKGEDALVEAIETVLKQEGFGSNPKAPYVFDAISEDGSLEVTLRFLDLQNGVVSTVLPHTLFAKDKENFRYPFGVTVYNSAVPTVHSTHRDFGYIWSRYLTRLLEDGRLKGHPFEVVHGGLHGVLTGLQNLKSGKASGVKYVYKIEETRRAKVAQHVTNTQSLDTTEQAAHELSVFPFPKAS